METFKKFYQFLFPQSDIEAHTLTRDVWVNCTPQQKIVWTALMELYHPKTIAPFYYHGPFTALNCPFEFGNIVAGTIYFALNICFGTSFSAIKNTTPMVELYDDAGNDIGGYAEATYYLEPAGVNFWARGNIITLENLYFGGIQNVATYYETVKFIGYTITF